MRDHIDQTRRGLSNAWVRTPAFNAITRTRSVAKVTTPNCLLDGFGMAYGTLTDADGRDYVEGALANSETGVTSGSVVRIYCGVGTVGVVMNGVYVVVEPITAGYEVRGPGLLRIDGEVTSTAVSTTSGEATLLPGAADHQVAGVDVLSLCDTIPIGTTITVGWHFNPADGSTELRVVESCCPP